MLTSFDSTGLSSLTSLTLQSNSLTSFNGTGLSSLSYFNLANNSLTSFDATSLSSLSFLDIDNNPLTVISSLPSSLSSLNLNNTSLTSFDATGLTSLGMMTLTNNHIRNFSGISDLSSLWFLTITNNCLVEETLDPSTVSWLNASASDTWQSQSLTCPPVPPICSQVTDVPAAECEALLSIYENTDGDNWVNTLANDNKWGISTTVNNWYAVDVWNGHVVAIDLEENNVT